MTRRTLGRIFFAHARGRAGVLAVTVGLMASRAVWSQHVPVDVIPTPPTPPPAVWNHGIDQRQASENAIRAVRVVAETARELTLDVDYAYTGDHGGDAAIAAHATDEGTVIAETGHAPGTVTPGERRTRVTLAAAANAPASFASDAILLQMLSATGDPLSSQTVTFRKTWSNPTAALPVQLPLVGATPPPSSTATVDTSRIVARRVASDGTVELVYGDGTVKHVFDGGYTIVSPSGQRQTASFISGQPPTAPDPPPDDALYSWLQDQKGWLLQTIRSLVGNDDASVNNFLAKEPPDASLLHQIWLRQAAISTMVGP